MSKGHNIYDRLNDTKAYMKGADENPLLKSMKDRTELEESGLGEDLHYFVKHQKNVFEIVMESFENAIERDHFDEHFILRKYEINIETGQYPPGKGMKDIESALLMYWANPWLIGERLLGREQLSKGNPQMAWTGFNKKQKYILRDLMDPSIPRIGFTAGRGCAKTWIVGVDGINSVYLIPSCEYMVVSGSDKQSLAMYKFFRLMMGGSRLEQLVDGEMMKRRANIINGGYVESFPSSLTAVQSQRSNKVIVDESCEVTEDVRDYAYGTLSGRRYTKAIYTGTPNYMIHWFYDDRLEYERQDELRQYSPLQYADLPYRIRWRWHNIAQQECDWIPNHFTQSFIDKYGINSHQYKIMVLGQFAPAGGTVYDMDRIRAQIIDDIPKTVMVDIVDKYGSVKETVEEEIQLHEYVTGVDYGFSEKHPTAFEKSCEDQNGTVYCIDEHLPVQDDDIITKDLEDFVVRTRDKVYADSGAVGTVLNRRMPSVLSPYGLSYMAVSFKKYKMEMVGVAMGLVNSNMIRFVKRKVPNLIKELEHISWDENSQQEQIKKGGDDCHDAWIQSCWGHRNALMDRNYRRVEDGAPMNLEELLEPTYAGEGNPYDPTFIYRGY